MLVTGAARSPSYSLSPANLTHIVARTALQVLSQLLRIVPKASAHVAGRVLVVCGMHWTVQPPRSESR